MKKNLFFNCVLHSTIGRTPAVENRYVNASTVYYIASLVGVLAIMQATRGDVDDININRWYVLSDSRPFISQRPFLW